MIRPDPEQFATPARRGWHPVEILLIGLLVAGQMLLVASAVVAVLT